MLTAAENKPIYCGVCRVLGTELHLPVLVWILAIFFEVGIPTPFGIEQHFAGIASFLLVCFVLYSRPGE